MALLAFGQGLLFLAVPDPIVRGLALFAAAGALMAIGWTIRSARRR